MATWLLSLALTTENGVVLIESLLQEMRTRHMLIPGMTKMFWSSWQARHRLSS
jgi:hypothetical protein